MRRADTTSGLPLPPDPSQDRAQKLVPQNIADVLTLLHILLSYGRHLAITLEHRAAARGFSVIAQFFGTARVPVILARLARGMLRAMALQRVLLARAARGRDLVYLPPRRRAARAPQPAPPPPKPAGAEPPPPRPAPLRRPETDDPPDLASLPSLEQFEAEIRHRPVGRTIADICRDLGVSPSLCEGSFWNALFEAITWYRGNLPGLMKDFRRREVAFEPELNDDPNLGLPEQSRDGIRRMLGFFIGEPPATPFWVPAPPGLVAAEATGPP